MADTLCPPRESSSQESPLTESPLLENPLPETTHSITRSTVLVQSPNALSCGLDDDLVLMTIDNGAYYGLNKVGKRIWSFLENPVSVESICDQLQRQFDVAPDTCEKEVLNCLSELLANGIVCQVGE